MTLGRQTQQITPCFHGQQTAVMEENGLGKTAEQRLTEGEIQQGIGWRESFKPAAQQIFKGVGRQLAADLLPRIGAAIEQMVGDGNTGQPAEFHRRMDAARG